MGLRVGWGIVTLRKKRVNAPWVLGQTLFSPAAVCGSLLHLPEYCHLVGEEPFPVPKLGPCTGTHYCRLQVHVLGEIETALSFLSGLYSPDIPEPYQR